MAKEQGQWRDYCPPDQVEGQGVKDKRIMGL
jgi:hypothetical protein